MKIRKAIKKIAAVGMMVGLAGSMVSAADLNDYPAPFIQNGQFSGTLVVGNSAAAQDVIGVSDIAMSLQAAATVTIGDSTSSTTVVEGDAYEFTKSSDKLNLWQNLSAIKSTLTSDDLNALADGTFKGKSTESYTQKIKSPQGSAAVQWEDYNDISEEPALYLKLHADQRVIEYNLNFGTGPASDVDSNNRLEDFEDEKITMLGKEYTVTKAENTTSNNAILTLMSGAVQDTLEVGQTKTYTINGVDYEVTVMVVSGDTSANALAKLIVNDEVTKSLSADQTYTLKDGTDLGIKEVLPTKSGDVVQNLVEFYLGAEKLVLDGNDHSMDIGDNSNIEDVAINVSTTSSSGDIKINSLDIIWAPSSILYIPVGGSASETAAIEEESDWVDFLNKLDVDIKFGGVTSGNTEEVKFVRIDDNSIGVTFTNKDGIEYKEIPLFYGTASLLDLGKDTTDVLNNTQNALICDEDMFFTETDEITRVLQLRDIKNTTDSKYVKLKDLGTGQTTNYDFAASDQVADVDLDGATFQLTVEGTSGCARATKVSAENTAAGYKVPLWTKYGSKINISDADTANYNVTDASLGSHIGFYEDKDGQEEGNAVDAFEWNLTWDSSNTVVKMETSVFQETGTELSMRTSDADSKKSSGYSKWGTLFELDSNPDQPEWTLTIPEEEMQAEVYMTAGTTTISSGGSVSGTSVILQKIDVGATKLASEIAGLEKTQNLILVGGPCANSAVEAASDDFPTCSGWTLEEGEAIIQLVEQTDGHVAMLVAGTMAPDTRTATTVVAEMTKLQALADGVTKQLVTVVSGQEVLTDVPEVEVAEPAEEGDLEEQQAEGEENIEEELEDVDMPAE